jgi:hypothetical protein
MGDASRTGAEFPHPVYVWVYQLHSWQLECCWLCVLVPVSHVHLHPSLLHFNGLPLLTTNQVTSPWSWLHTPCGKYSKRPRFTTWPTFLWRRHSSGRLKIQVWKRGCPAGDGLSAFSGIECAAIVQRSSSHHALFMVSDAKQISIHLAADPECGLFTTQ